jgi:hypothetical protein
MRVNYGVKEVTRVTQWCENTLATTRLVANSSRSTRT